MPRSPGRLLIVLAAALLIILIFGRSAAVFYTNVLWHDAVGYGDVFWKRLFTGIAVQAITGALGAALIMANLWYVLRQLGPVHLRRRYGNLEIAEQVPRAYLIGGALLASVLAGWWLAALQFGGTAPMAVLAWLRAESWGVVDPLFGHDLSFYIFGLPVYSRLLEYLLIILVWSILLVGIGYVLIGAVRARGNRLDIDDRPRVHFAVLIAGLLIAFGVRYLLSRYELLLEGGGFGGTIGYTDVYARLPARLTLAVLSLVAAAALLYGALRRLWAPPALAIGVFLLTALGMGVVYPAIVQKVQVEPNELAREIGYIRWNMEFTRAAYALDRIERRNYAYQRADAAVWGEIQPALEQLPLWDATPLQTVFNEVQAGRDYYQFPDVDVDRYANGSAVAIGVREIRREGMPSQTWSNLHLNPLYTRGLGVVAAPAADKRRGDPVYWLGDLDPVQRSADAPLALELTEPSVYFGETMTDYAVVGHGAVFSDDADMAGHGTPVPRVDTGVQLTSFLRVLAFAWRFGDQNLLFARELGDTSRLIFRRRVTERVMTVAPFLQWDSDPHPVVLDGRVIWILDGYTTSSSYPLSRDFPLQDRPPLRYIRSSVKATVDAVSGEMRFYALPDPDPILRTYSGIHPGLIRDWDEMPEAVQAHLRYPSLLFRVQSDILEEYHLERPEMFYAGQDVWQLPPDMRPQLRRPARPLYTSLPLPGELASEFLLMSPFIARGRQNMTALLMARNDAPHYGELLLLELPRDDQIRGPSQIQSIIEQDAVIAQQLSLLRQQGSTVEMGQLRIIPTGNSIVYVKPLFLSAQERGIPQLQQVIVSDGTAVTMAGDLFTAVAALGGEVRASALADTAAEREPRTPGPAGGGTPDEWRLRALDLMREADERLRAGDFAGFGASWSRLRTHLEQRPGGT